MDEVHLQQDLLEQPQDTEPRPEQALLPVPTEDVPHPTRHVQGERLTVQGEDPAGRRTKPCDHFTKSKGFHLKMIFCLLFEHQSFTVSSKLEAKKKLKVLSEN